MTNAAGPYADRFDREFWATELAKAEEANNPSFYRRLNDNTAFGLVGSAWECGRIAARSEFRFYVERYVRWLERRLKEYRPDFVSSIPPYVEVNFREETCAEPPK